MNGADALCDTLLAGGVDVCFANPGTSEMHFVAALDRKPQMRCVLGLFEGVVTGAADGYARMADRPAATLLHTGPGLANGLANIHNAKRANTPMINVVGDHAVHHLRYDAPLTSDIEGLATPMSHWVKTAPTADLVSSVAAEAIFEARTAPGRIATLILPADAAWNETSAPLSNVAPPVSRAQVDQALIRDAAEKIRNGRTTVLFLSGVALRANALTVAGRIAKATGVRLLAQQSNARMERGAGRVAIERVPYPVDLALALLKDVQQMILVGGKAPVGFFAYPGKPGEMTPTGCDIFRMASAGDDLLGALEALADELGVARTLAPQVVRLERPQIPGGALTADAVATIVAALMPDNCIINDESVTSGRKLFQFMGSAPPHDYLQNTGGAIGQGLPAAVGAAIACPERKVISLEADGSGMYTLQALWTMARENLDVVTIVFANRSYAILHGELKQVGAGEPGRNARRMLDLDGPALDWAALAKGMGVDAVRTGDCEEFRPGVARRAGAARAVSDRGGDLSARRGERVRSAGFQPASRRPAGSRRSRSLRPREIRLDAGAVDCAGRRLRQRGRDHQMLRPLVAGDPGCDEVDDVLLRRRLAGAQHAHRLDRLAPFPVRHAEHDRVGDGGMRLQCGLDLGRIDVLAAGLDQPLAGLRPLYQR